MRIIRRMQRGKPCSRHSASQGRTEESIAGRRQAGPPLHPPPGSGLLDGQRAPRMDVIPLLSRGPSLSWIGRCPLRVSWRSLAQLLKLDLSTAKPQTAQGPCPPAAGLHQKLAGPWFWAWPQLSARVPSITAHPPENPWCPPPPAADVGPTWPCLLSCRPPFVFLDNCFSRSARRRVTRFPPVGSDQTTEILSNADTPWHRRASRACRVCRIANLLSRGRRPCCVDL